MPFKSNPIEVIFGRLVKIKYKDANTPSKIPCKILRPDAINATVNPGIMNLTNDVHMVIKTKKKR